MRGEVGVFLSRDAESVSKVVKLSTHLRRGFGGREREDLGTGNSPVYEVGKLRGVAVEFLLGHQRRSERSTFFAGVRDFFSFGADSLARGGLMD